MIHLREEYGSESIDELFCYFMKTVLRIQKNGAAGIPIDIVLEEPVNAYLKTAMSLVESAQPMEISDLILGIEYEQISANYRLTKNQTALLILIKELSKHMRFDNDPAEYLLSTENLWNDKANEYATKTFYPNLPLELQKREGIDSILENISSEFFEPDNF